MLPNLLRPHRERLSVRKCYRTSVAGAAELTALKQLLHVQDDSEAIRLAISRALETERGAK